MRKITVTLSITIDVHAPTVADAKSVLRDHVRAKFPRAAIDFSPLDNLPGDDDPASGGASGEHISARLAAVAVEVVQ